jgi:glycerol-3-phosphate dehydrogenase
VELCRSDSALGQCIDPERTVLVAEVVFAIREEMARTLADIIYRRLMLGLDADQGRPHYEAIAAIAATELDWNAQRKTDELHALRRYSDSFRVPE